MGAWRQPDGDAEFRAVTSEDMKRWAVDAGLAAEEETIFVVSLGCNVTKAHMTFKERWWRRLLSR